MGDEADLAVGVELIQIRDLFGIEGPDGLVAPVVLRQHVRADLQNLKDGIRRELLPDLMLVPLGPVSALFPLTPLQLSGDVEVVLSDVLVDVDRHVVRSLLGYLRGLGLLRILWGARDVVREGLVDHVRTILHKDDIARLDPFSKKSIVDPLVPLRRLVQLLLRGSVQKVQGLS